MIRAGFASGLITPPLGISLGGYFNQRPNTGVLDDLNVRVAVFEDNAGRVAGIVSFDLLYTIPEIVERVTEELQRADFPAAGKLLFCATHTHTGPDLRDVEGGTALAVYKNTLVERTAAIVRTAHEKMVSVTLSVGAVKRNPFAHIRRYWMRNGKVTTNPGKLNPDIVRPESEVDAEIGALVFRRAGTDEVCGIISNICNHTDTIGGTLVSADWPGVLEQELRCRFGGELIAITLIGASGDVNHFDIGSPVDQTCPEEAKRIGRGYAEIIEGVLRNTAPIAAQNIGFSAKDIEVPRRTITTAEIEAARALVKGSEAIAGKDVTSEDLAKGGNAIKRIFAQKLLDFIEKDAGSNATLPLRSIRFSDSLTVCSLPGEPFNAIGTAIKRASPFPTTFVASNAMASCGYIPLKECFARGGYETLPMPGAGLCEDAADMLVDAVSKMLAREDEDVECN